MLGNLINKAKVLGSLKEQARTVTTSVLIARKYYIL